MPYSTPVSIVLTLVFAVAGLGYLAFAVRSASGASRASDVLHLLMSIAMLSMPWAWGMKFMPPGLQLIVFGLGTAFFTVLLLGRGRFAGLGHHAHGGAQAWMLGYHVAMMAAMVVMAGTMLAVGSSGDGATASMPGMNMGAGSSSTASSSGSMGAWSATLSAFAVIFLIGTAWSLFRLLRARRAPHPVWAGADAALLLLMSGGMALACAAA